MSAIVVKAGGRALEANMQAILADVTKCASKGLVFVHGGGDVVTRFSERLGVTPRFVVSPGGIRSRYTSAEEMEIYTMVMAGKLNKEIVALLNKLGAKAVGLSGADGPTLLAERKRRLIVVDERGRKVAIEGGYTGKIVKVETALLASLLGAGYVVALSPIAYGREGELLNVDADQAAVSVAEAIKAECLVLLTDVEGVIFEGRLLERLTPEEAEELALKLGPGMNRKLLLAARAVKGGVKRVVISSGLGKEPLLNALRGSGTVIAGAGD